MNTLSNHSNYNCRVSTDSGEEYLIYANWLHNNNQDNWKGWTCETGSTRLFIDKNLEVFGGECKNQQLGNALTGFSLVENAICQLPRCTGCTDDLMTSKTHPGH